MLTRFVRVLNNEQQQTAVKVSSCFLYDKSNEVNLMYFWICVKNSDNCVSLVITRICTVE